jgi:hypothetical protein
MDDAQFNSSQGQKIFLFFKMSRLAVGAIEPPIQWVLGVVLLRI